jgi:hypothetical protein
VSQGIVALGVKKILTLKEVFRFLKKTGIKVHLWQSFALEKPQTLS